MRGRCYQTSILERAETDTIAFYSTLPDQRGPIVAIRRRRRPYSGKWISPAESKPMHPNAVVMCAKSSAVSYSN